MAKSKILLQLDTDSQASVFDGVVAVDSGVDHLFRHASVQVSQVRELAYGAMFTRGMDDLRHTAMFVGGIEVAAGRRPFIPVLRTFFCPMSVSVKPASHAARKTGSTPELTAPKHGPGAE